MDKGKESICTIRIMFPVISDETAIAIKKEIEKALVDVPDIQVHFMIMGNPVGRPQVQ